MATGAVDYTGITETIVSFLQGQDWSPVAALQLNGQPVTKVMVFEEATAPEMSLSNMPLVNVRLAFSQVKQVSIPDTLYEYIHYEIDVYAVSFTSYRDATRVRDSILRIIRNALQKARAIHADLETTQLVPNIKFGAFQPEGTGGHVAVVTFTFVAEAYVDATGGT